MCDHLHDDVHSVYDTGDITQNCQDDVEKQSTAASTLEKDTQWWEEDGDEDVDEVVFCFGRHLDGVCWSTIF